MLKLNGEITDSLHALKNKHIPTHRDVIKHVYNSIPCVYKTPSLDRVLRCVELPPERTRVMIIGQDPYPQDGAATGLAFSIDIEVKEKGPGQSVYKLAKEIYRCINFPIPARLSGNLDHWQRSGVMLLNSALTTMINKVDVHGGYWRSCVRGIIYNYIQKNPDIVVLCLGSKARSIVKFMDIPKIIYMDHPNKPGSNIFGSDVFIRVNDMIQGMPIDWRLNEVTGDE